MVHNSWVHVTYTLYRDQPTSHWSGSSCSSQENKKKKKRDSEKEELWSRVLKSLLDLGSESEANSFRPAAAAQRYIQQDSFIHIFGWDEWLENSNAMEVVPYWSNGVWNGSVNWKWLVDILLLLSLSFSPNSKDDELAKAMSKQEEEGAPWN